MRLLIVIAHFFGGLPNSPDARVSGQHKAAARIAALNSSMVALYRHFGPFRRKFGFEPELGSTVQKGRSAPVLDVVILAVSGKGLLDHIGIDPSCYEIEHFKGDPQMLMFEAQRVLRDRVGGYDFYGVTEDDIAIYDPTFFQKLSWFEESFGSSALLKPTRYELLKSGIPVSV